MTEASSYAFVSIDEARAARGLRLVVPTGIPSPWSEAAKSIFDAKGLDYLLVKFVPRNEEMQAWTLTHNVPVVFYEDEPPRTGWAEIVALGERLGGVSLVPGDADQRATLFGLGHEILGERGISWNTRLLAIHAGLTTDGQRGFPSRLAAYLAAKYGYRPDEMDLVKSRLLAGLRFLAERLEANRRRGSRYFLGDELTALDICSAAVVGVLSLMPQEKCPMLPLVRHAFETIVPELADGMPQELVAHRDFVYERHLKLPVRI
jgi:hypothetical protein